MASALVIVESPAKAKTINKFLGRNYTVKASMGHVRDLPKRELGVDEKDFTPTYAILSEKRKTISDLKKAAKNADDIYLASDPDREGEAICWHLMEVLRKGTKAKFHRVLFNEITKRAIKAAFEKPIEIDVNKVEAQQARRILDRLVGYKISPLLWDKEISVLNKFLLGDFSIPIIVCQIIGDFQTQLQSICNGAIKVENY